jgi:hypothetical protein
MNNDRLDAILNEALKRDANISQADETAAMHVLARLGPLPRQKMPFWRLPGVLLDWKFTPAWPRVAALASCAALGFAIGLSGVDRTVSQPGAPYSFASGASSPGLFDPSSGGLP